MNSLGKNTRQSEGRSVRFFVALTAVVAVSISCCGCRMCADPYDYCQPTFTGECGQQCCPTYRAGSVLTPNCGGCEQCDQCGHVAAPGGCSDCGLVPADGTMYEEPYDEEMAEPATAAPLRPLPQAVDQSSVKKPRYQTKPVSYNQPATGKTSSRKKSGIPSAGAPVDAM